LESLVAIFLTSFAIGFSGVVTPGPVTTMTVVLTARRGFWAGPRMVLGHGVLELALLTALVLGLGPILARPLVGGLIGVIGAGLLGAMAAAMIWSLPRLSLQLAGGAGESPGGLGPFWAGVLTSISNPYWVLWWATVGPMVIQQRLSLAGVAAFFVGHILSDLVWLSFISGLVAGGRRFISSRVYRIVVGTCALVLVGFGVYFLIHGIGLLGRVG
jgi:threonine/homoserine/homoserine lactone efflux protein